MLVGMSQYLSTPNLILRKKAGKKINCRLPNRPAQEYRTAVWADQESMLVGKKHPTQLAVSISLFTIRGCVLLSRPL